MLDSDAPFGASQESSEQTPAPRRRRRAASRPAGPPAPVVFSDVDAPAVSTPAQAEEPEVAETGQPAEPAEAAEATEAAEEEPSEAEQPVEDAPEAVAAGEASDDAPAEEQTAEGQPSEEQPADDQPAAEVEAKPEKPSRRRSTRRRGRRSEAAEEAAPEASETTDPVGQELEALSAERATSQEEGEAEASSTDVSAALDDLAAAISGNQDDSDSDETSDEAESSDSSDDDDEQSTPTRRRRRRGGRRRRRASADRDNDNDEDSSDEDSDSDNDESDSDDAAQGGDEASDDDNGEQNEGDDNAEGSTSGRRRRRRRRRGEDTGTTDEEGVDVVVKVREPRRTRTASDEITGIEGSTRMEAKRQRRREGRAAGRRRAPILSEAEFLARRESVERQMLIRQADDYTQIAVMEDGILVEHYVDRDSSASLIGNIYLGRVQNVLPSMEAAFIDIGRGRNAVLYAGEVDWDAFGVTGADRKVEKVLKSGQPILVQVTKDPIGAKGARLTAHISIPGRYVVYCPGGQLSGISRKLPENERGRLKGILDEAVGEDASVIVRTAAEGASEEELVRDVNRLKAQWEVIEKKVKAGSAPQQLYTEPDLTVRIVRDLFTEDFTALVVDGNGQGEDAWDTMEAYVTHVAPQLASRLRRWDRETEGDIFTTFRVHEQVAKALERKVHLPSGGSLIIDRTEAMTVIDVNTGKFTGSSGNLETTVTSNNLEAAEEIVRQLRLRDIGGIIVIDFIDMVLPANRELLLRRLVECLGRDRTRHQVAEVTSLGLVQMTRKRIGTGLAEAFTVACENCNGRGYHVHDAPVATQAPADGGDRDGGRRNNRRGGRNRRGQETDAPAAEVTTTTTTRAPEPVSAPVAEPVVEDVVAHDAAPIAVPVIEPTTADPEHHAADSGIVDATSEVAPDLAEDLVPDAEPETDSVPEESGVEPEAEVQSEAEVDVQPDTEADAQPEAAVEAEPVAEPTEQAEPQAEPTGQVESTEEIEATEQSEPQVVSEVVSEPAADVEAADEPEASEETPEH